MAKIDNVKTVGSKPVSQVDIMSVINAHITTTTNVLVVLGDSMTKVNKLIPNRGLKSKIREFKNTCDLVFSKNGLLIHIMNKIGEFSNAASVIIPTLTKGLDILKNDAANVLKDLFSNNGILEIILGFTEKLKTTYGGKIIAKLNATKYIITRTFGVPGFNMRTLLGFGMGVIPSIMSTLAKFALYMSSMTVFLPVMQSTLLITKNFMSLLTDIINIMSSIPLNKLLFFGPRVKMITSVIYKLRELFRTLKKTLLTAGSINKEHVARIYELYFVMQHLQKTIDLLVSNYISHLVFNKIYETFRRSVVSMGKLYSTIKLKLLSPLAKLKTTAVGELYGKIKLLEGIISSVFGIMGTINFNVITFLIFNKSSKIATKAIRKFNTFLWRLRSMSRASMSAPEMAMLYIKMNLLTTLCASITSTMLIISLLSIPLAVSMLGVLLFNASLRIILSSLSSMGAATSAAIPGILLFSISLSAILAAIMLIPVTVALLCLTLGSILSSIAELSINFKMVTEKISTIFSATFSMMWETIKFGLKSALLLAPLMLANIVITVTVSTAVATMMFIALALSVLQLIQLNPKIILTNVDTVMSTADKIINGLAHGTTVKPKEDKNNSKSPLLKAIESIGVNFIGIFSSLFSSIYLFNIFTSVVSILFITLMLKILQSDWLKLDHSRVTEHVRTVIDSVKYITDTIFGGSLSSNELKNTVGQTNNDMSQKEAVGTVGSNAGLSRYLPVIDAILSFSYLVGMLLSVTTILALAGMLKWLANIELDSDMIKKKIGIVLESIKYVTDAINKNVWGVKPEEKKKESGSWWDGIKDFASSALGSIKNVAGFFSAAAAMPLLLSSALSVGVLAGIANQLNTICKFKLEKESINKGVDNIVGAVSRTVEALAGTGGITKIKSSEKAIDLLVDFSEAIEEFADTKPDRLLAAEKLCNAYGTMMEKTQLVDIEKLKTVSNIFQGMAKLSDDIDGNIDDLVEVLAEKLVPILERLGVSVSNISGDIKDSSQLVSRAVIETAGPQAAGVKNDTMQQTYGHDNIKLEEVRRNAEQQLFESRNQTAVLGEIVTLLQDEGIKIKN